jgi:hypothetical protein
MTSAGWLAVLGLPLIASAAASKPADEECAGCHQQEFARFRKTPMAQALYTAADSEILRSHASLTFEEGRFEWRIVRDGNRSVMTVTRRDGVATGKPESITVPLLWAFGRGRAGQTYVFERNGALYESRVSFYNAIGGLDLTMGAQASKPADLDEAAGHPMDSIVARDCFGCHSTGAVSSGRLHLESIVPGVGCASCHGNAGAHTAAMKGGGAQNVGMKKLAGQSAEEISELCGACHRTWSQIAANGPRGLSNVRFQPYRLANSKCYDATDARISCTACHDPHGSLETKAASYDSKCVACHSVALHTKTCKIAKTGCVSCHMPKYELPGSHDRFTDHQIRVARAGSEYPN